MFEVRLSQDAEKHLKAFSSREQGIIVTAIEDSLTQQPTVPGRNRKLLRENPTAAWELRAQKFRVLYNVDRDTVTVFVVAIAIKDGNKFIVEGKEFTL